MKRTFPKLTAISKAALPLVIALSIFSNRCYSQASLLDTTFNGAGYYMMDSLPSFIGYPGSGANAVAIQPDGKIVAAGNMGVEFALFRFQTNGLLDTSFGGHGYVINSRFNGDGAGYSILLQPDGKILVCGWSGDTAFVTRYYTNGTLDSAFGRGGVATTTYNTVWGKGLSLILQPNGKIVMGGWPSTVKFAMAGFNADGTIDNNFGTGGIVITTVRNPNSYLNVLASSPGGKILAAGSADSLLVVLRYDSLGVLDSTFGINGVASRMLGAYSSTVLALALQPDGKIVAAGQATDTPGTGPGQKYAIARFNANGSTDSTFGINGATITRIGNSYTNQANAMVIQADGKIITGGQADYDTSGGGWTSEFTLVRYNADGSIDTAFGQGGILSTYFPWITFINGMALQSDGKLVAVGENPPPLGAYLCIARYLTGVARGSMDSITICHGSSYLIQAYLPADSFVAYSWSPSDSLSSATVLNPTASPAVSTTYILTATDTGGRQYFDTVIITVDTACENFVWPGDANEDGVVNNYDLLPTGLTYGFTGPARPQQDINWYAHYATPWSDTITGGVNDNYSDCNGDGIVNINDVNAILQNYHLIHPLGRVNPATNRSGAPALTIVTQPDTVYAGDTLYCHILLGDSSTPANNVYGLAFTFNFNKLVVDSGSEAMTFPDSWLATQSQQISLAKNNFTGGAIYAALSRIDHTPRSGYGEIATVSMVITTDNIDGKNLKYYTAQFQTSGLLVINQAGDTIPVNVQGDSAIIGYYPTSILEHEVAAADIKLFPNPSNNTAQILVSGGKMSGLSVTDVLGQQIAGYEQINASHFTLPTGNLIAGVYFAQIRIGNQVLVKKFLVQH